MVGVRERETLRHDLHTLQYCGGLTVGVWQDVFCVSVIGRAGALFQIGPTACPSLLLRGLATGFRTSEETGHPLSRRASPDRRLGHLVPTRGRGVDLGRFDGGRWQRQTGVPNTLIIVTSPSCICVKICFPRASIPKPFRAMPITSWPSRIRAINWGFAI